jgi:hypothetical protein
MGVAEYLQNTLLGRTVPEKAELLFHFQQDVHCRVQRHQLHYARERHQNEP